MLAGQTLFTYAHQSQFAVEISVIVINISVSPTEVAAMTATYRGRSGCLPHPCL